MKSQGLYPSNHRKQIWVKTKSMNFGTHSYRKIRFRDNTAQKLAFHHVHRATFILIHAFLNLEHLRASRGLKSRWHHQSQEFRQGPIGKLEEWTGGVWVESPDLCHVCDPCTVHVRGKYIHHGEIFHSNCSLRRPNWQKIQGKICSKERIEKLGSSQKCGVLRSICFVPQCPKCYRWVE